MSETREEQGRVLVQMGDVLIQYLGGVPPKAPLNYQAALVTALILSERIRDYVEGEGNE